MNIHSTIQTNQHRIVFETDEVLFPFSAERIWLAVILDQNKLQIVENNNHFTLHHFIEKNIQQLLKVGFIRIHPQYLINPAFIFEFKLTESEVELLSGKKIPVSNEFRKNLLNYFKTI